MASEYEPSDRSSAERPLALGLPDGRVVVFLPKGMVDLLDEVRSHTEYGSIGLIGRALYWTKFGVLIAERGKSINVVGTDGNVEYTIDNVRLSDNFKIKVPEGSADDIVSAIEELIRQTDENDDLDKGKSC